jgi:hypothetical protein
MFIGRKLAMQELRLMIVLLVLSFRFLPLSSDKLRNMAGQQKVLRSPQRCYVRLEIL